LYATINKTDEESPMARYVLPNDPALSAADVVPNDSADLPNYSRMLYVGVGGSTKDVHVTTINGSEVTFKNVPTGILMVQARKVWAADTTATEILALW
jgi:hypothetical protein